MLSDMSKTRLSIHAAGPAGELAGEALRNGGGLVFLDGYILSTCHPPENNRGS